MRRCPPAAPHSFFATRAAGGLLLVLALAAVAGPAEAQLGEAAAIRRAADDAAEVSRRVSQLAGPGAEAAVLATIRRSCAARGVTRLDEIPPALVEAQPTPDGSHALWSVDLRTPRSVPTPAPPAVAATPPGPAAAPGAPGVASVPAAGAATAPASPAVAPAPAPAGAASPPAAPGPPPSPSPSAPPAPAAVLVPVERDTEVAPTPRGLELRRGQLRTTAPLELRRDDIGTIEIDAASDAPGHLLLGWSDAKDAPRLRRNNARLDLAGDGRVHTYRIDAAKALARGLASGTSVQRLFLATRGDAPVRLEALRVLPRSHRYADRAWGTAHESRAGELRRVLFLHPEARLAFEVEVPGDRPVFESGLALLSTDGVAEFEVAVEDGAQRSVLLKRLVRSAPWEDVALDLAPFAGRRVRISLAVRGTRDAIALWSSPLVRPRLGGDRTEPFVVLLEDALRADRLALYGGPVASPGHEALASSGLVFERAFAQATQTRPSVPSMMTSLLPSTTGVWDFSDALSDHFVTLAEALRACGFATASFLQNGNAGPYAGLAQGFDVVFDEETSGPRTKDLVGPGSTFARWTAAQQGRPYFAYVHALDPHGPYDPAKRPDLKDALSGDALLRDRSLDAEWLEKPTAAARRLLYDAEVAENDAAVGQLLEELRTRGDLPRATVALVADHGEFLGEHGGLWRHHPPGHVEVARVPFLLLAPGAAPARIATPVALLDLTPTLLELAGADASALPMQGRSLAPALRGGPLPERAIPADEMVVQGGERRASGCGSFATKDALWLRSCTRDGDYSPDRLLPQPSTGPAPLRRIGLGAADFGQETPSGSWTQALVEAVVRSALQEMQDAGVDAWRHTTRSDPGEPVTEPGTSERLRALGYAQ